MSTELQLQLREPREVLAKLSAEESELLHRLIAQRRIANRRSLDKAVNEALTMLPRMVRPMAKKVMFGG